MANENFFDNCPKTVDFSYLKKFGSRRVFNIPTCFDHDRSKFIEGSLIQTRITRIYDPSKFWIVTKIKELEIFQKYLFKFYYMNHSLYKIPEAEIELDLYCAANLDNSYYRGVIVGLPISHHGEQEVQVLFIDFGTLAVVSKNNIYYLNENCLTVPQFAIRASLAGLRPLKTHYWTVEDLKRFQQLVSETILINNIVNVIENEKILEIEIFVKKETRIISVHKKLISEKSACFVFQEPQIVSNKNDPLIPQTKFLYLFPTHELLESGKVPFCLVDVEYQLQVAPLEGPLARYYKNKE